MLQMYFDDLPIWGFLGKVEKNFRTEELTYFLFTHFHFDVAYNGNRVIGVNTFADAQRTVDITGESELLVEFSYSVKWNPVVIPVRFFPPTPYLFTQHLVWSFRLRARAVYYSSFFLLFP